MREKARAWLNARVNVWTHVFTVSNTLNKQVKKIMNNQFGTNIERGIIAEVCEQGYKVRSISRDGILTPEIPGISGATFSVGDRVYFFIFEDGHGAIIAAF